jgi:hypothetical protein
VVSALFLHPAFVSLCVGSRSAVLATASVACSAVYYTIAGVRWVFSLPFFRRQFVAHPA